jgi:hypothetical protein
MPGEPTRTEGNTTLILPGGCALTQQAGNVVSGGVTGMGDRRAAALRERRSAISAGNPYSGLPRNSARIIDILARLLDESSMLLASAGERRRGPTKMNGSKNMRSTAPLRPQFWSSLSGEHAVCSGKRRPHRPALSVSPTRFPL